MNGKIRLPSKKIPLNNFQLEKYGEKMGIPHFQKVCCINELPKVPKNNENRILNLDSSDGNGTHWIAYHKNSKNVLYYDPIGNVAPPSVILNYFKGCNVFYNRISDQKLGTVNCGHLCLKFLKGISSY